MMFASVNHWNRDAENEVWKNNIYSGVCADKTHIFYIHGKKTEHDIDYLLELK